MHTRKNYSKRSNINESEGVVPYVYKHGDKLVSTSQ
jgi:hypothetical protein